MNRRDTGRRGRQGVVTLTITVIVLLTLLAACVATVFAATSSPAATPASGKVTLRLGWNEGPLNLNPFVGYSTSYEIWMLNYDTLVGIGADGLPSKETGLAEDWSLSPDQKKWTFKIRPGVKWQDGQPLTAADAAWTFNTILRDDLSTSVYLKGVKKAVAVDDTTLKVCCTQPKANMLTTQIYIYVLPEHIWGKLTPSQLNTTFRNPTPIVGSGPFQTVEFKKDDYVKMVRDPSYWGKQPSIDEVIFQYYTNDDVKLSVVDEGALGDAIWNYKGDTYAPDYDLALWDFMGYIDPGDSAACFTTDQIENYNEMNWSNAQYDKLTEEQYREMDTAKCMELLK